MISGISPQTLMRDRLRAAAELVGATRRGARLSQRELAERAEVSERTVRRIEGAEPASIASYWAVGYVLGLPPDWFVFPQRLDPDTSTQLVTDAVDQLSRAGVIGPNGIALVRELASLGLQHGPGAGESIAAGALSQLQWARQRLAGPQRPAGRG
jgi:transcriptional regulator with XRE-family HTH domain